MNKKGFTLIEMLAVISILSLLVLLAIPNVIDTLNKSKKSAFEVEAREMYEEAINEYVIYYTKEFSNVVSGKQQLKLSGNDENKYYITLSGKSKVTKFYMTNGKYKFELDNANGIEKTDLDVCVEGSFTMNSDGTISGSSSSSSVPDPVAFSTDSWATIANAVRTGNTSAYSVGDTKQVTVAAHGSVAEQTLTVRIVNMSTPSSCSESSYSQSACGFVIEFVDIIEKQPYHTSNTIYMYASSSLRTYLIETLYKALPQDLKNVIIVTQTYSGCAYGCSTLVSSPEYLYLLSVKEIYNYTSYDNSQSKTRQLDYYYNNGITYSSNYTKTIKYYNGSKTSYWLRNPYRKSNSSYTYIWETVFTGTPSYDAEPTYAIGISPAFRVG